MKLTLAEIDVRHPDYLRIALVDSDLLTELVDDDVVVLNYPQAQRRSAPVVVDDHTFVSDPGWHSVQQPSLFSFNARIATFTRATIAHVTSLSIASIFSEFRALQVGDILRRTSPRTTLTSMRHASKETLKSLTPLLQQLRTLDGLVEKGPGVFYRKSKAFLHFHDDPAGIFVDVRLRHDDPFTRLAVTTRKQQAVLVTKVKRALELARKEETLRRS